MSASKTFNTRQNTTSNVDFGNHPILLTKVRADGRILKTMWTISI